MSDPSDSGGPDAAETSDELADGAVRSLAEDSNAGARQRRLGWIAFGLVVAGVVAMVVPGLLRDGVCGLFACADVTPEVAVGRPTGTDLAVVVPEEVAGDLLSLRLVELNEEGEQNSSGEWIVFRTSDSEPTYIPLGEAPEGFDTRTPLESQPESGVWVLEASFGCAATLVRFSPVDVDPGFVVSSGATVTAEEFSDDARTDLQCSTAAPTWQRILFFLGIALVSAGAIMGLVLAFRGPIKDDPEWYGP